MKHLQQSLNTSDDSFTYTVSGEAAPSYLVDSNACLFDMKANKQIGKFKLGNEQWHLHIGEELYMSGPKNGMFKLPEFELDALTKLINAHAQVVTDAIEWIKSTRARNPDRVYEDTAHACLGRVCVMLGLYGSKPESILSVINSHGHEDVTLADVQAVLKFVLEGV